MKKNPIQKLVAPNALSAIVLFLLFAVLFGSFFTDTRTEPDKIFDLYFFGLLRNLLTQFTFISFISTFVFVVLLAFLLFQCNENFSFIRVRTMIPILLFIFFLATSNYKIEYCFGLISCFFILITMWLFLPVYQEKEPVGNIFNTFFFISVGSFFSFDFLLLMPVFWISFSLLRIGSIRTLLASIIGLLVPYIICLPILYLTGGLQEFLASLQQQWMMFSISNIKSPQLLYQIFFLILLLISFIHFLVNINADKIKTRQILYFFYLLTFTLFFISVVRNSFINMFPAIAMLSSISLGHYFSLKNSRFALFCFIAVIAITVVFYIVTIKNLI